MHNVPLPYARDTNGKSTQIPTELSLKVKINMNTVEKYHSEHKAIRNMLEADTGDKMLKTRFNLPKSLIIKITTPQILTVLCVFPHYCLIESKLK